MSAAKVACRAVKCGEGGAKAGFQWRGRSLRRSRARANSGSDGCDSLGKAGEELAVPPGRAGPRNSMLCDPPHLDTALHTFHMSTQGCVLRRTHTRHGCTNLVCCLHARPTHIHWGQKASSERAPSEAQQGRRTWSSRAPRPSGILSPSVGVETDASCSCL